LPRGERGDRAGVTQLREALEGEELTNLLEAERILARLVKWSNEERLHSAWGYLRLRWFTEGTGRSGRRNGGGSWRSPGTAEGKGTWACNKAPSTLQCGRALLTFDPQVCHCR
jgi:hypothetical protein